MSWPYRPPFYEDQALDILPTVHEGPVVRQMEQKGIRTEKGELNRWIKATNRILKNLKQRIADLKLWIEVLGRNWENSKPVRIWFG